MNPTGSEALRRLRVGNERFQASANPEARPQEVRFRDLSPGQAPFAAVVACSDSRVPVEAVFSQEAGQLFVARVAGNVVGPLQLGSLEFAVEALGVSLILILGHTGCGAVAATLASGPSDPSWMSSSNLRSITRTISENLRSPPAGLPPGPSISPLEAVWRNVRATVQDATRRSGVLSTRVRSGDLAIVGAVFHLETGVVEFSDPDRAIFQSLT